MDQDTPWCGGRPRPKRHCVRRGPSSLPHGKGYSSPHFSTRDYYGQTAGWSRTTIGTEMFEHPKFHGKHLRGIMKKVPSSPPLHRIYVDVFNSYKFQLARVTKANRLSTVYMDSRLSCYSLLENQLTFDFCSVLALLFASILY